MNERLTPQTWGSWGHRWELLGFDSDPAPGDPDEVMTRVQRMRSMARQFRSVGDRVREGSTDDVWRSSAGVRVSERLGRSGRRFEQLAHAFDEGSEAIAEWVETARSMNADLRNLLDEAEDAKQRLDHAEEQLADLPHQERLVLDTFETGNAGSEQGGGEGHRLQPIADPPIYEGPDREIWRQRAEEARDQLAQARRRAHALVEERDDTARTVAERIRQAIPRPEIVALSATGQGEAAAE